MGMENFGIEVDVQLKDDEARSSILALSQELEKIKKMGESGLSLDLGLSGTNAQTIKAMTNLVKEMKDNGFKNAFEVSDKSISSLMEIRKVAESIGKLSKEQVDFFNTQKAKEEANGVLKQYKSIQGEIKKLQGQLSRTTDDQVVTALGKQLSDRYNALASLKDKMNDKQLGEVVKVDKKNADDLEKIYGKVFDSIQKQARSLDTQLTKLSTNKLVDVEGLEKAKKELKEIMNLDFIKSQSEGYSPLSKAFKELESLKLSVSALNKGAKLDGFNQSDNVKEWKNLYNIITATKKEMSNTGNSISSMSHLKTINSLNKQLEECYNRMSDVDKKTVDTLSNFGKNKLDTFFTKSADGIIAQAKTLENSLMNIGKNAFADKSQLEEYQQKVREIVLTLNSGILEGTLNEFNIPVNKSEINEIEKAIKNLGDEAKRSLKIDDFIKGINTQLSSMKNKFKDALPEQEIRNIEKLLINNLKNTALDDLPSAFRKINDKVQTLRNNAQEVSKVFKKYDGLDEGLNGLLKQFDKLSKAQALSEQQAVDFKKKIESLYDSKENMNLFDSNAMNDVEKISSSIKELRTEMNNIKMPDFLADWKKLNTELTKYQKALSTAYDSSTMDKLQKDINKTETQMSSLANKMDSFQLKNLMKIEDKSDRDLQNYFRKQADGAIQEIERLDEGLNNLLGNEFADSTAIKLMIEDIRDLKKELKNDISMNLLNADQMNFSNKTLKSTKEMLSNMEKSAKKSFDGASQSIKDYSNELKKLQQAETQLAKSQSPEMAKKWTGEIDKIKSKLAELKQAMNEADKITSNSMDSNFSSALDTKLSSQVDKMLTQAGKLKKVFEDLKIKDFVDSSQLDAFDKKVDNVFNSLRNLDSLDGASLNKISGQLRELVDEAQALSKVSNFAEKFVNELEKIESACDTKKAQQQLENLRKGLTDVLNMPASSSGIDKVMSNLNNDLKKVETTVSKTSGFFDDLYDSMRTYTLGNIIGDAIVDSGREAINVIKELDSALVEMTRVAPADFQINTDNLKAIKEEASAIGKEVGKSSADVIIGIGEALRVGAKSISDAKEIAKQSAIFSNVADLDQKDASTTINSVLSAFGGIKNALQPVRGEVKGATSDYTNLQHAMDLINFAGRIYTAFYKG